MWLRIKKNLNCPLNQFTEQKMCLTKNLSLLMEKQIPAKQKQALLGSNLPGITGTNKGVNKSERNDLVMLTPVWGMHKKIPNQYPLRTLLNLKNSELHKPINGALYPIFLSYIGLILLTYNNQDRLQNIMCHLSQNLKMKKPKKQSAILGLDRAEGISTF